MKKILFTLLLFVSFYSQSQLCTAMVPPHVPDPTGGTYHILTNTVTMDTAGGDYYVCSGVTLEMTYSAGCNYLLEDGATLIIDQHEGDNVQAKGNCTITDYESSNELVVTMESTSSATKPNYPLGLITFNCANMVFNYSLVGGSSPCASGMSEDLSSTSIRVYPNPVYDFVNLESELTGIEQFIIMDGLGRVVKVGMFDKEAIIDVREFHPGIYYLKTQDQIVTLTVLNR